MTPEPRNKSGTGVAGCLCFLVMLVAVPAVVYWMSVLLTSTPRSPELFTREAWAKADAESRGRMVIDLQKRHPLVGLSQADVLTLLGRPDSVVTVADLYAKRRENQTAEFLILKSGAAPEPETWASVGYKVGHRGGRKSGFMALSDVLAIEFQDGQVTGVKVHD